MTSQACLPVVLLAAMASACGGPLKTGTTIRPSDALPEEGPCPSDTTVCGTVPLVACANLQNDPEHCGSCERACAPGVVCMAGVCQRVICQGQPMFSETPLTSRPSLGSGSIEGALLADINGDGRLDLITWPNQRSASDLGTFYVSLGRTAGGFGPAEGYTVSKVIRGIMAVDLNQDGAYDLFLSLWTGGDALQRDPPYLELWLGSTDGHLLPAPANPASDCALPLALADVSGDGKPDLVAYSNKGGALEVYLSDSPGSFHPSGSYATTLSGRLLVMDWNGDGFPDLVLAGSPLQLFYNRGDGTFDDVVDCGLAAGWDVVADFNHDGHMDLATYRNYGTEVDVLLGQGACRFAPAAVYAASGGSGPCSPLEAADMDGDGQLDLLCANQGNMLTGLLGNPDGSFQAGAPIALGAAARKIVVGDVTGDQRPDLVTIDDKGQVSIWENTCP